jgi:hypothetical protein
MVAFKRDRVLSVATKELAKWEGNYQDDDGGTFTVKGDRWTMKAPARRATPERSRSLISMKS